MEHQYGSFPHDLLTLIAQETGACPNSQNNPEMLNIQEPL